MKRETRDWGMARAARCELLVVLVLLQPGQPVMKFKLILNIKLL